jgi:hypothetical protein
MKHDDLPVICQLHIARVYITSLGVVVQLTRRSQGNFLQKIVREIILRLESPNHTASRIKV